MVFEPLSAFAVACNALQVTEYGWKVLHKAVKCHKASTGLPHEQDEIQNICRHLESLTKELRNLTAGSNLDPSTPLGRLQIANEDCSRSAGDFINVLDQLRAKQSQNRLQSIVQAFKLLFHKDEIESLEKRIVQSRSNLILAFLVFMQDQQTRREPQSDILRISNRTERRVLDTMKATYVPLRQDIEKITKTLESLKLKHNSQFNPDDFYAKSRETAEKEIVDCFQISHDSAIKDLQETLSNLMSEYNAVHWMSYDQEIFNVQHNLLESLFFGDLEARREQISTAYADTYKWIWRVSDQAQSGSIFISWLDSCDEDDLGIYWISGKPGSGKSTLIRHIDRNVDQNIHCSRWSREKEMLKVSWFFWSPGSRVQRSFPGLLRSLLYQLLKARPGLMSEVLTPDRWRAFLAVDRPRREWTIQELKHTLQKLSRKICATDCILMIVDGLDELEGPDELRQEMLDMFYELTQIKSLKLCLASRPWLIFSDALKEGPHLRLENLTRGDMNVYVSGHLQADKNYRKLQQFDDAGAVELVNNIVRKAEGVFLWVRLVVRDLLRGLRDGDTLGRLCEKLDNIPVDLDEYLSRILESIEADYKKEASVLIQLMLHEFDPKAADTRPRTLLDLSLIEELGPDFALDVDFDFHALEIRPCPSFDYRLERMSRRLSSRCMGLLESNEPMSFKSTEDPRIGCGGLAPRVDFLHRCCRDFLRTGNAQLLLYQYSNGPYSASLPFCNAMLAEAIAFNLNWALYSPDIYDWTAHSGSGAVCAEENGLTSSAVILREMDHLFNCLSQADREDSTICQLFASAILLLMSSFSKRPKEITDMRVAPRPLRRCLESWDSNSPSFIFAIAVAYCWVGYLERHLDSYNATNDGGRSLLTLALSLANDNDANVEVIELLLKKGSKPNERDGKSTVCARWLSKLRSQADTSPRSHRLTRLLIKHGGDKNLFGPFLTEQHTWEGLKSVESTFGDLYAVTDLLEDSQPLDLCSRYFETVQTRFFRRLSPFQVVCTFSCSFWTIFFLTAIHKGLKPWNFCFWKQADPFDPPLSDL